MREKGVAGERRSDGRPEKPVENHAHVFGGHTRSVELSLPDERLGSGAVIFLVAIPALLPLHERLELDRRVLACAASLVAGVNFLP